jgi:serine-type D-Ala-D-Ala carboxypeptidase/endopeptidase
MLLQLFLWGLAVVVAAAVIFGVAVIVYAWRKDRAYSRLTDTRDLKARIDKMAVDYVAKRPNVCLVIGVLQGGQSYTKGFGRQAPVAAAIAEGEIVFEIGSVTKVFTGIALAKLEADGCLALDDSIRQHLPEDVVLSKAAEAITLRQLATHTSGLPCLPDNFEAAAQDHENPYVNYKARDLYDCLRGVKLLRRPGKKSEYSNLGMGLLGHLLALKANKPFEILIEELICEPLGMNSTTITLSPDQRRRLMPGHSPEGRPVSNWDLDVLAPAGAFRSTVEDMLKFLKVNLTAPDGPQGQALARAQEQHFSHWTGSNIGLGWHIENDVYTGLAIHWHNGGTGGYVSFVGLVKSHQLGVVLLSNYGDAWSGDDTLDQMGFQILKNASKISLEGASEGNAGPREQTAKLT